MNIGRLDRLVGIYSRAISQNEFGAYDVNESAPTFLDNAWVKKIPKKSDIVEQGGSIMINQNSFEFVARYNETLWKPGYYFQIAQSNEKYWIRGVEEIGRKEGMRIFAEYEKSRSI